MPEDELLLEISRRYQAWLEEHGLLDYDDILRKGLELFETAQKGKGRLFRPFTHLLVDEFQDMNPVPVSYTHLDVYKRQVQEPHTK